MKRRELFSAAMLLAGAAQLPGEQKLTKAKREISEAMAKVPLDNADAPDLLPRARRK